MIGPMPNCAHGPLHGRGALQDAVAIYRRLRDRGRMMLPGLTYVSSWVDAQLERCFQLMETDDPATFDPWISNWSDLMEFEIVPVFTSQETREKIAPLL